MTEGRGGDVVSWEVKEHYHKDNLRHLPRFPGFFVTFRILVTSLYSSPSRSAPCRLLRSGSAETRTEREKKRVMWRCGAGWSSTLVVPSRYVSIPSTPHILLLLLVSWDGPKGPRSAGHDTRGEGYKVCIDIKS